MGAAAGSFHFGVVMTRPDEPSNGVLIRDLFIFQLKLWMDGLKDVVLAPLSLVATLLDLLLGPRRRGPRLYAVLRMGERFDLWLNLFGAAKAARRSAEGLFAGSEPGDGTMLGALEELSTRKPPAVSSAHQQTS
jgi:hypothetical protein